MKALKTDLIGITGNNGLRGEFRQYRKDAERRELAILAKLESMEENRAKARRWLVATIISGAAASSTIVSLVTRLFS